MYRNKKNDCVKQEITWLKNIVEDFRKCVSFGNKSTQVSFCFCYLLNAKKDKALECLCLLVSLSGKHPEIVYLTLLLPSLSEYLLLFRIVSSPEFFEVRYG